MSALLSVLVAGLLFALLLLACAPDASSVDARRLDWFARPVNANRAARRGHVTHIARGGIVAPRPGGTLVSLGTGSHESVVPLRRRIGKR